MPEVIRRERAWKRMVLEWRWEQIIRACLNRHPRSVLQPSVTYPTCFAPTAVSQNTVTTTNITQSLSLLWRASTLHYPQRPPAPTRNPRGRFWTHHQVHPRQQRQRQSRTSQMPQKYRPNLRGKGWVCVEDAEEDAEEVDKVWEMQKRALLDSTTLGKRTWSEYRWPQYVSHPSLLRAQSRPCVHPLHHHQ